MNALDTNLLVYAHRRDASLHREAAQVVRDLAEGAEPWAIPWPCAHEFIGVVTHPRVYSPPSTLAEALAQVETWMESPTLVLLAETADYWPHLREQLVSGRIAGPRVHDARIAALCRAHGVRELLSADRDFGRFPSLRVRNPLVR